MKLALLFLAAAAASAPVPIEVAQSPTYTEGPVLAPDGSLYISHNHGIFRLSPKGELSDWVRDSEAGFNGHKILPDGTHLVCASKRSAIWRLDAAGKRLGIASSECDGKPLRAPNDLTLDAHGGFYFSDPGGSREAPIGSIHYVGSNGKTLLCAGGMRVPNGLVIDPSGMYLYVAETVPNRILKFRIESPGRLGPMEVFATLPSREGHEAAPDGLAVDRRGNIYVAHLGTGHVLVLSPSGKRIATWNGGNYDVSNLVFNSEQTRLFVTGSVGHRSRTEGRVYRLDLKELPGAR